MKTSFLLCFLCLFFISCSKHSSSKDSDIQPSSSQDDTTQPVVTTPDDTTGGTTTDPTTGGTTTDVPTAAFTWDADILFVDFSSSQEDKVLTAVDLIKQVIASEEFRTRVLNHTYNGQKTFVDNNGLSNEQIYQKLLDGAETLNGNKNNTMDIEVQLYYASTSTIGYTYATSKRIWMNTKYFNTYTPVEVSDNLTHEWIHKLGFGHSSSWTTSRAYSVPYAIGYLMEELAADYY